ncbi:hypothetical protein WA026_011659 [Henosepilachna vigintioctopunctata]|uniref:28S ribosomal protein S30, mitochondrial n=1 Tax=Henosepilachna vigintioctopunctata TaxID=420089 RepID=A0AAW1TJX8_9CUCU
MSIIRWKLSRLSQLIKPKIFFSTVSNDSEYTATPQYPPILDLSFKKKKERERNEDHEKIRQVKTVEEKQIKLNMPRYYGFKIYMFHENEIPYNDLDLAQYVTRTHLVVDNDFHNYYENIGVNNAAIETLKQQIVEALLLEVDGYRKLHDLRKEDFSSEEVENVIGSCVVKQLNRVLTNLLCRTHTHLIDSQVDYNPRIESTWQCGGLSPPEKVKSYRRHLEWMKSMEEDPVDRLFTYIGRPYVTLRSNQPLSPIVSAEEAENTSLEIPTWRYDPRVLGIATDYRRIVNIPGFWPGDAHKFGILQYLKRGHHLNRKYGDSEDSKQAVHRQGILASFAWLNAQANHLGFTTFNDITYPLVTQTIITNGQLFSFYTYQMNTMLLHSENTTDNPKKNICWGTPEMKLYEKIENGKLEGFNEDVLSKLVKYYCNASSERLGVNLTPYLSQNEKIAADYEDEEKRKWLEREYKFITSNRPRQHLMPEEYAWEKIYKIDHQTRFMDKRMKHFELRQIPHQRKYDDRKPRYIPRALRPHLPRNKGRNAKEFFP